MDVIPGALVHKKYNICCNLKITGHIETSVGFPYFAAMSCICLAGRKTTDLSSFRSGVGLVKWQNKNKTKQSITQQLFTKKGKRKSVVFLPSYFAFCYSSRDKLWQISVSPIGVFVCHAAMRKFCIFRWYSERRNQKKQYKPFCYFFICFFYCFSLAGQKGEIDN